MSNNGISTKNDPSRRLILASTSPYRKELLEKLAIPFVAKAPLIDEDKEKDPRLSPLELAEKLAYLKAQSLAAPGHVVIGGDQLIAFQQKIIGKAYTREKAIDQLLGFCGHTHDLITAVCVFDGQEHHSFTNITRMKMKSLTREQIEKYVELDQPLDCAGSYKIEKHGISLFEKIESDDFTAIQGLPLIQLCQLLEKLNLHPLKETP